MDRLEGLDGLRRLPPGCGLCIGNFDGVHLGHRRLLAAAAARVGPGRVVAVTFEPHPYTVLRPWAVPPRLTTFEHKCRLLEAAGADRLLVLPPEPQVLNLTAEAFFAILRDEARPACLVEGATFTFGRAARGNVRRLREWCEGTDIHLEVVDPVDVVLPDMTLITVSSSAVRFLALAGRVREAGICLGRPHTIEGVVVEGARRGRTLGFPTANLDVVDQAIPADGVYAGRVSLDGRTWPAAVSIGATPTFGGDRRLVEAHLHGFTGELYGHTIRLELLDWVRDQRRFSGVDALRRQLERDVAQVRGMVA